MRRACCATFDNFPQIFKRPSSNKIRLEEVEKRAKYKRKTFVKKMKNESSKKYNNVSRVRINNTYAINLRGKGIWNVNSRRRETCRRGRRTRTTRGRHGTRPWSLGVAAPATTTTTTTTMTTSTSTRATSYRWFIGGKREAHAPWGPLSLTARVRLNAGSFYGCTHPRGGFAFNARIITVGLVGEFHPVRYRNSGFFSLTVSSRSCISFFEYKLRHA